jgi:hypothetical protein
MLHATFATILILAAFLFGLAGPVVAQEAKDADTKKGGGDLATAATNPVGALIQLQFQDVYTPNSRNSDGYANTAILQPVIPFELPEDGYFQGIVTRTTIPYVTTPEVFDNRESGMGDITSIAALTHTTPGHPHLKGEVKGDFTTWGPIGAVVLPTASKDQTGADVWQLGPGLIGLTNLHFPSGDSLMLGGLGYHVWDVSGDDDDPDISKTFAELVIVYKYDSLFAQKGWYVRYPDDLWSYDWKENEFDQIPVGAYLGRVFSIGKQPVNVFGGAWYNPVGSDKAATADYAFKINFSFLFPVK